VRPYGVDERRTMVLQIRERAGDHNLRHGTWLV
jgi:hypothetical protein